MELGEAVHPVKRVMKVLEGFFDILQEMDKNVLLKNIHHFQDFYLFNRHFPSVQGEYFNDMIKFWKLPFPAPTTLWKAVHTRLESLRKLGSLPSLSDENYEKMFHLHNELIRALTIFHGIMEEKFRTEHVPLTQVQSFVQRFELDSLLIPRPGLDDKEETLARWQKLLPNLEGLTYEREELLVLPMIPFWVICTNVLFTSHILPVCMVISFWTATKMFSLHPPSLSINKSDNHEAFKKVTSTKKSITIHQFDKEATDTLTKQ